MNLVRLRIDEAIRADHDQLTGLVTAGLAGVPTADIEIRLAPSDTDVVRWLVACRADEGCGRATNVAAHGWRAHAAATQAGARRLAGNPDAHHPPVTQRLRATYAWSGRAYPHRPPRGGGPPRWPVSVWMPADPRPEATGDIHPRVSRYARFATAPPVVISDWTEELVHVVAHEVCHVQQRRHGRARSEIDAERWAHEVLAGWRTQRGLPVVAIEAISS